MIDTAQATALVEQLYRAVLGRLPDPFGYDVLVPLVVGGYDPALVRFGLAFGSTEAASRVGDLYKAELGRPPDSDGLSVSLSALANGASLDDLRAGIAASPEAGADLNTLYQQMLGRVGDAPGLANFTRAMGYGKLSLLDVRTQLAISSETGRTVAALFQGVLGRDPTQGEVAAVRTGLDAGGTMAQTRVTLAATVESQARLVQAYELNFGIDPAAATLATQEGELGLGRAYSDVVQLDAKSIGGGGSGFAKNYGYSIPGVYSLTGSPRYLSIFTDTNRLYDGAVTTQAVPTTGSSAFGAGTDTVVLDVQTTDSTPLSFIATLDGKAVGGATVSAPRATRPSQNTVADEVTFTGGFGAGLHTLRVQVTSGPSADALSIRSGATFDGNAFLLLGTTTDVAGAAAIYPHAGPQPAIIAIYGL